jgi:hypothetical protein
MGRDNCRMPGCDNDPRPNAGAYSRKFCSDEHEVKFDHLKADADEARYGEREPEPDLPERDGPPY